MAGNIVAEFLDWLFGYRPDETGNTPIDERGPSFLGTPKPGALTEDAPAHFPNPFSMPAGLVSDMATAPDYSRVGVPQGNTRTLRDLLAQFTSNAGIQTAPSAGSTGNPVTDFINSIVTPTAPPIATPAQIVTSPAPTYSSPGYVHDSAPISPNIQAPADVYVAPTNYTGIKAWRGGINPETGVQTSILF